MVLQVSPHHLHIYTTRIRQEQMHAKVAKPPPAREWNARDRRKTMICQLLI
jgi:hypothetical protein